jgi:hypothetical protein
MAAGTDGELITYDTSGDPTTVPTGSSGQVLTSNGAGTTPTFQTSTHTPDDNSVTLAKMAGGTDGNLITYDASGDPAYVTTGTSGHVLTSGGTGVAPTFQAAAGGGKILQVIAGVDTTATAIHSTTYVTTGTEATITPAATSRILIIASSGLGQDDSNNAFSYAAIFRGSTQVMDQLVYREFANGNEISQFCLSYVDSPGTSSAITYSLRMKGSDSSTEIRTNYLGHTATITLMEIGA